MRISASDHLRGHAPAPAARVRVLRALGLFVLAGSVSLVAARSPAASSGDPVRGAGLFAKRCTGCHALAENMEGPRLGDVYGRKTGAVPGFPYSDALKNSGVVWDQSHLDKWLADTEALIPDNDMAFRVPSAEERADILAFLRARAAKPDGPGAPAPPAGSTD